RRCPDRRPHAGRRRAAGAEGDQGGLARDRDRRAVGVRLAVEGRRAPRRRVDRLPGQARVAPRSRGDAREGGRGAQERLVRVIDFELTDEQRLVKETAREFAEREILPYARDNDRAERFDESLPKKLGDMGFLGPILSEEYGGRGIDYQTYALIVEE